MASKMKTPINIWYFNNEILLQVFTGLVVIAKNILEIVWSLDTFVKTSISFR